jgi:hypothetical protein
MPLVLALMVVAVVAALALVPLARGASDRARAQAAADATALAGAAAGETAAKEVARANHARLLTLELEGGTAWVRVGYGEAEAVAKAQRDP